MPGHGYRILKPQPVQPLQRIVNIIGDMQDRMRGIEATRPGFSVTDTDPTTPGLDGQTHLNKAQNRLWAYTDRGWITADSYQRYAVDSPEVIVSSASYTTLAPSVQLVVPSGGAFVNVYLGANVRADAGTPVIELALNDGVDLVDSRVVSGNVTTAYSFVASGPANSAGGVLGTGGWLTYWSGTAGTRTLSFRMRSPGAVNLRAKDRVLAATIFGGVI